MYRSGVGGGRDGEARPRVPLAGSSSSRPSTFSSGNGKSEEEDGDDWFLRSEDEEDRRQRQSSRLVRPTKPGQTRVDIGKGSPNKDVRSTSLLQCPVCTIVVQPGDAMCFMCDSVLNFGANVDINVASASASKKEWECSRCTYQNPEESQICDMCGSSRRQLGNAAGESQSQVRSTTPSSSQKSQPNADSSSSSLLVSVSKESKEVGPGKILNRLRRLNDAVIIESRQHSVDSTASTLAPRGAHEISNKYNSSSASNTVSLLKEDMFIKGKNGTANASSTLLPPAPAQSDRLQTAATAAKAQVPVTKSGFQSASTLIKSRPPAAAGMHDDNRVASSSSNKRSFDSEEGEDEEFSFDENIDGDDGLLNSSDASYSEGIISDSDSGLVDFHRSSGAGLYDAGEGEDDIEEVSDDGDQDFLWGGANMASGSSNNVSYTIQHTNGRADYVISSALAEECPALAHFVSVRDLVSVKGATHIDFAVFSLAHASAITKRNYDKRRATNQKPVAKQRKPAKRSFKRKKSRS